MDGGPAEDALYNAFWRVDIDPLGRGDLVVAAAVSTQVDVPVGRDVMHEVADFICMCFDDDFVGSVGIHHADNCAVGVDDVLVDVRADVVQPKLLSAAFKSGWAWVIEVGF